MITKGFDIIIDILNRCVNSATDLQSYLESYVGDCSSEVINRLFSRYDRHEYAPISDFAVGIIAAKRGPKLVNTMIDTFKARRNPSLHGAMLELWFSASLQHGGLELYDSKASHIETWPQCGCIILSSTPMILAKVINVVVDSSARKMKEKNKRMRYLKKIILLRSC